MNNKNACTCSEALKLIFPCSGCSDVGGLTDQAARKMTADGIGKMYCLAGIGGKVRLILETTQSASKILAIDGCKLDCARRTLREAGFTKIKHVRISNHGFEKGESPLTDENIAAVARLSAEAMTAE